MDIQLKEVQHFGLVSMILSAIVCLFAISWDFTVGSYVITRHDGYGYMQILVIAGSGLYSLWAWTIHLKFKQYIKLIHNFTETR